MVQMTLNQEEDKFLSEKEVNITTQLEKDCLKHPINYCLNYLKTSNSIWDMRCQHKFQDDKEVKKWVLQDVQDHKNDGHAGYCIHLLKFGHKVPIEMIIFTIMTNSNIMNKNDEYIGSDIFGDFNKEMENDPEVEVHHVD